MNGVQWQIGLDLLYKPTMRPGTVLFLGRLPMIVLTLALGAFLFFCVLMILSRAKLVCTSCGKVFTVLGGTQFEYCPHCGKPYFRNENE